MTTAAKKTTVDFASLGVPLDLAPMEAKLVAELPKEKALAVRAEVGQVSLPRLSRRRRRRDQG
jgi:hypothetical protein